MSAAAQTFAKTAAPQTRDPPSAFAQFHRPLILGLSVGHPRGTVGSIGPFVRLANGRPGFLAASFTLAPKGAEVGDWIHQPGPYDTAVLTGATRVGKLATIAAPEPGKICRVAAAAVELIDTETDGNLAPTETVEAGRRIEQVAGIDDIRVGDEVALVGCTSGYSCGHVVSVRWENLKIEEFSFSGAFAISTAHGGNFSERGDGGALIYRRSDMKALGLLFARMNYADRSSESLVLPLAPALDLFGAKLLA